MSKSCIKHTRIKTRSGIASAGRHNKRLEETKNANAEIKHLNQELAPQASQDLLSDWQAKMDKYNVSERSNSVLVVESILITSPEYFRDEKADYGKYDQGKLDKWVEANKEFIAKEIGMKRVLSITVHLDEATPHIHVCWAPIADELNSYGKRSLNAAKLIGGVSELKDWQTRYNKYLAHLGIERGDEKSLSANLDVKETYQAINSVHDEKPIIVEVKKAPLVGREKDAEEQTKRIQSEINATTEENVALKRAVNFLNKENKGLKNDFEKKVKTYEKVAEQLSMSKAIDLAEAAKSLGFERNKEKQTWELDGIKISISNGKWHDKTSAGHSQSINKRYGGNDAISLTQYATGCTFKSAVSYLAKEFGHYQAGNSMVENQRLEKRAEAQKLSVDIKPYLKPIKSPEIGHEWEVVDYLVNERCLDKKIVKNLINQGHLYASSIAGNTNVVWSQGRKELADISGTRIPAGREHRFQRLAQGSKPQTDNFGLEINNKKDEPMKLVLVESPLDAVSYLQKALKETPEADMNLRVMATHGSSLPLEAIRDHINTHGPESVVGGFDADKAGDKMHSRLEEELGQPFKRETPENAKDWNGQLKAELSTTELRAKTNERKKFVDSNQVNTTTKGFEQEKERAVAEAEQRKAMRERQTEQAKINLDKFRDNISRGPGLKR